MSYGFYKVLHLFGIMGLFLALGGILLKMMTGSEKKFVGRKWAMILHGISLAIIFVSGFGLMARIGLMGGGWPLWIWGKVAIWLIMGAVAALIFRKGSWAQGIWLALWVLGGTAAFLANYKPV